VTRQRQGVLLCLTSAVAFGAMAIFAKLAYRADVGVLTLLAVRFASAALAFWALAAWRGFARPSRRLLLTGFGLGLAGYSAQSGLFFGSLTRIDASLAALLLYAYPAIVTVAAVALRRERATRRRVAALGFASVGVVLVLAGGGAGSLDALGVAMALAAAVAYSAYILVSDTVVADIPPFLLAALVSTGAAVAFAVAGVTSGHLDLGFAAAGWGWIAAIVAVSTVIAMTTFFAGLARVGPSTASILSTVEPVCTVLLAFLAFGERLNPVQIGGGALVLSAVVLLQASRGAIPSWPGWAARVGARRAAS
jgi:drug/metabolite transporter (DMT)-like permease